MIAQRSLERNIDTTSVVERGEALMATQSENIGIDYLKSNLKRKLDLLVALPTSAPAVAAIGLLGLMVVLYDRHKPYVNVGTHNPFTGKKTNLWKIRTMIPNAQQKEIEVTEGNSLTALKQSNGDPRILPKIGTLFRKTSVDELPQILNILRGDISAVGPRWISVSDWRYISDHLGQSPFDEYIDCLANGVKFGATGLSIVLGRSNLSMEERLLIDTLYVKRANFWADLKIMALTPSVLATGK